MDCWSIWAFSHVCLTPLWRHWLESYTIGLFHPLYSVFFLLGDSPAPSLYLINGDGKGPAQGLWEQQRHQPRGDGDHSEHNARDPRHFLTLGNKLQCKSKLIITEQKSESKRAFAPFLDLLNSAHVPSPGRVRISNAGSWLRSVSTKRGKEIIHHLLILSSGHLGVLFSDITSQVLLQPRALERALSCCMPRPILFFWIKYV